ncbi:TCR/Tet family MFS transporter [Deinococcus sonorensis]|uniref:TCR/Tet family MFS transporter n=2 Tax=Deinococcus sonorensis TaxID=309891 RepID=A0AAU7U7G6_9DEIO
MRPQRPAALAFILITVLIDVMGIGLIIPVLPQLIKRLAGSEVAGAQMLGVLAAVFGLMQFVCAPLLGALSDRYGRRPVLLGSLLGTGLDYLLLYFAPNLWWLLLGRLIAGVTSASITVANAYIADVSRPEDRARQFGLLGATFGVGFILGPVLGGVLGNVDLRLPFAFAAGLALLNALYGLLVLPESLPPERRGTVARNVLNPFAPLANLGRYPLVRSLAGSFVLFGLAQQVIFSTWVLFTEDVLGWTPAQNGLGLALVGVTTALVQAVLVGVAMRVLGERRAILAGLLIGAVQFVLMGLARSDAMMYIAIVVGSLGGIAGPALQGRISRSVDEREQGSVQGALTGLNSLVGVVGPLLATWVFAHFTANPQARVPGAAFFMGAVFSLLATVLVGLVLSRMPEQQGSSLDDGQPAR